MTRDQRALLVLVGVVLLTTLPFINRAFFVDDYYFVKMAQGILEHPLRPYDFRADDAGKENLAWERGQAPRMVNPPLFHYYLAMVMKWGGSSEAVLRASLIPFSILALFSMYFLGKRFSPYPLSAAMLMALTPAYWLTSNSLLIDSMLIGVLLAGLWLFVAAHERRSPVLAWFGGLLLGLAMLVKYFGVIGIVLALVWVLLSRERRSWAPGHGAFVAFALVQLIWAFWNISTYGQSHLWATLPRGMSSTGLFLIDKVFMTASFLGGGAVFLLVAYALLLRRSELIAGSLFAMLAAMGVMLASPLGGFTVSQSIQLTLWVGASAAFLIVVLLWGQSAKEKDQHFLLLWLGIGLVELIVVMPWTAGRYMLCLLPALCWLLTRLLSERDWQRWGAGILGVTGCVGLLVANADYAQANTIRRLADVLTSDVRHQTSDVKGSYYLGDTFSGYEPYLKPLGWQAAFPNQTFAKGDLLLIPRYRQSSWWRLPETLRLELVDAYDFQSPLLVRVMDIPGSAGWYASVWGSLPYVFTRDPLERFEIYRVLGADSTSKS